MASEVRRINALSRRLAAVECTVKIPDLASVVPDLLGEVWTFLRERYVLSTGHNVVLYLLDAGDGAFDAWFGVEVHEAIPPSGRVVGISTPSGPAATTVHWGPYADLPGVHAGVRHWCAAEGYELAGPNWEVYGDWSDDPTKLRTDVFYQLKG
jgi:effector-binding domain-containing protein